MSLVSNLRLLELCCRNTKDILTLYSCEWRGMVRADRFDSNDKKDFAPKPSRKKKKI